MPLRILILFYASLLPFLALSQSQKSVFSKKVEWQKMAQISDGEGGLLNTLVCSDCQFLLDGKRVPYLVQFRKELDVNQIINIRESWKPIPFWEISGLDTLAALQAPPYILEKTELARKPVTRVGFCLVRKKDGIWERLHQFTSQETSTPIQQTGNQAFRVAANENSVLSSGQWLKLGIIQTGVYAMTGAELTAAGLPVVGKNSNHLRMFGTGGKMLSEANKDFKFNDLSEIAIQVQDGGDGIFDANDRVLFFGEESNGWFYEPTVKAYQYQKNIYSDTTYYFVGLVAGDPLRIPVQSSMGSADLTVDYYPERWIYSPDNINVLSAGREWYADVLDFNTVKEINFPVSNLLCDSLARIRVNLMARSNVAYPFQVKLNDITLCNSIPATVNFAPFGPFGNPVTCSTFSPLDCQSNNIKVWINYAKQNNPSSVGYLNFVEINAKRKLDWTGSNFGFRSSNFPGKKVGFALRNFPSSAKIWNVTYPARVREIGHQGGNFVASQDTLLEFFAFQENNLPRPVLFKPIQNQNIRGMVVPDMIIVTHPRFLQEANRLANFRREKDTLSVEVLEVEKIYNEFSSGSQDVTAIRNMAMLQYYKEATPKLRYLLLFGDCSFDYKNRVTNNTNFVPIYEGIPSLNIVSSYASDDYFGILNRTKGGWDSNDLMDIGVGRLPAKSEAEAKVLVDKLINYHSSTKTLGPWRTKFSLVADDGDGCTHSDQADDLANNILTNYPNSIVKKIYLGAYNQVSNAGGFTSPDCTNDVINSIESGTLMVNYTGHGGETVWADEYLFTNDHISKLKNLDRLPIFITATCDFGRHDLPAQLSGAENLMVNAQGGSIAVVTTGRPVNSFSNKLINDALYKSLFVAGQGFAGRMGDVMKTTKNLNSDKSNNRGFCLLGDPSFKIAMPESEAVITLMPSDTIRGMDLVEFSGEIRKNNVKDANFNGKIFATVFDRPSPLQLNDNEGWGCKKAYPYLKNILYYGSEKVTNGEFHFRFKASKDVSYQVGNGKINMYAHDELLFKDAAGCKVNVKVGGLNPNPIPDDEGPIIRPFMNDTTFIDYGLVGTDANLLVFLEDSSGINTSGLGLGHDLTGTLDGSMVYILNSYYQSEEGNFKKGSLLFPLRNLSYGLHSITIKAWDNNNNSNTATIWFMVSGSQFGGPIVKNLNLFPNPFIDDVYLTLENVFAGNHINIQITIHDILGRPVINKSWDFNNSVARPGAFKEIAWNGCREDGTRFPAGTYLCEILLKSDTEEAQYKINKKIVLLR